MKGFELVGGTAVASLDEEERAVMARIVADVGLLLSGEAFEMDDAPTEYTDKADEIAHYLAQLADSVTEPTDPAVLRVLPNAAPTDREVADEFRRLTEPELRDTKVARLRSIWLALSEDGPQWEVSSDEMSGTAAALTDVRLVMASRLGIETDHDAQRLHTEIDLAVHAMETGADSDLDVEPERVWLGMLYDALTWLQETLIGCLLDRETGIEEL